MPENGEEEDVGAAEQDQEQVDGGIQNPSTEAPGED